LQEKHIDWLAFIAQYHDGSFGRFAVDAFTLLRGNYRACDAARVPLLVIIQLCAPSVVFNKAAA
jgi:hypothetical protein